MNDVWNPWHGCKRYSEGCLHCYMFRRDESVGRDPTVIEKTSTFDLPVRLNRSGEYKVPFGSSLYVCMTSDFFLEEADVWRPEVWRMINERADIAFTIITKRITRAADCLPPDWGNGYPNVTLCCTVENQRQAEIRLPVFARLPVAHKEIICEPLLGPINLMPYLSGIEHVGAGGESGDDARICDYENVLSLREQCLQSGVGFSFHQTGAHLRKDGRIYTIPRALQHAQAKKAGLNLYRTEKTEP